MTKELEAWKETRENYIQLKKEKYRKLKKEDLDCLLKKCNQRCDIIEHALKKISPKKLGRFLIRFADLMKSAISWDVVGEPIFKIFDAKLVIYVHDIPTYDDNDIDECFHFYRQIDLNTLRIENERR